MKNKEYPLYELEKYSSLNQMVYSKAKKRGNAIAFQYMQKKELCNVSYQKFLEDILIVGNYLETLQGDLGISDDRDSHIAILGENAYTWLVVFMAVVMSGNVAIPMDKELDLLSLRRQLSDADADICFYSDNYADVAKELYDQNKDLQLLPLKDLQEKIQGTVSDERKTDLKLFEVWEGRLQEDKAAAIFFTSGTSGQSKGVMLSQKNMISDINMACQNVVLEGTVLSVLPFHHAFGLITSVLKTFNYECTVFINSSLKHIKRDMLIARPQTMMLVPLFVENFYKSIWQAVKERGQTKTLRKGVFISKMLMSIGIDVRYKLFAKVLENFGGKLRYIICGGAALQEKYVKDFRLFGIEILNGYGITECSPVIAVNRNYYHRDGSVGQILPGCEVRIATTEILENGREKAEGGRSVKDFAIGEIQVKGPFVMKGYYNNKAETEAAFDDSWFCTGDLGYIDRNGFLYITGRMKNLIILPNGENVSAEELEQRLLQYDYVKEVVVSGENGVIQAEVFLDYEAEPKADVQIHKDIELVNKSLPGYKRIEKILVRESEFEKTTTKKIVRKRRK